jgi:TonB family protein
MAALRGRSGWVAVVLLLGVRAQRGQGTAPVPVRVSGGVMAGRILTKTTPVVPKEALCAHVRGPGVLHAVIGEDGRIEELHAISGPEMLRKSYIDAVRQWTYQPYLVDGVAVPVETTITLNIQFGAPPADCGQMGAYSWPAVPSFRPAGGAAQISGGVMEKQILERIQPVYPPIARAAHVSGSVVLRATIGKDGMVERLEVVSGPEMLRASAMEAVRHWVYKPYLLNFEPVEVETMITVNYRIEEPKKTTQ